MRTPNLARTLFLIASFTCGCAGSPDGGSAAPLSVSCPQPVPMWSAGTAYAVGDVVAYGAADYRCRQAHTSLPTWTPDAVPAL